MISSRCGFDPADDWSTNARLSSPRSRSSSGISSQLDATSNGEPWCRCRGPVAERCSWPSPKRPSRPADQQRREDRPATARRRPTRELLDALGDKPHVRRMFPMLSPLRSLNAKLDALADAMMIRSRRSDWQQPEVPAGFTYFGQFVDHDITLDLTSLGDKENDPLGIQNFRTPSVDLTGLRARSGRQPAPLCARNPAAGNGTGRDADRQDINVRFGGVTGSFRTTWPVRRRASR